MASVSRRNRKAILGKKLGMSQVFEEDGTQVPVTILQAGPCTVLQVKTAEKDGYRAFQLGFDDRRKDAKRPQQAYLDRLSLGTKRFVREVPFIDEADLLGVEGAPSPEDSPEAESGEAEAAEEAKSGVGPVSDGPQEGGPGIQPGAQIGAGVFRAATAVDVAGMSKGRGFAGTIKRYGHSRGDKSHGGKSYRLPGSTGQHTDPGRVFKGKSMPGHHGHAKTTIRNLRIVRLDEERNLLLVKGAVPGPNGGYVYIEESLS